MADAQIPLEAVTEHGSAAKQAAWLRDKERIQRNADGSWTHWKKDLPLRPAVDPWDDTPDEPEDEPAAEAAAPAAGARAATVIRRARVAQAASALDHPTPRRHASGGRQRPRPLSAPDRAQQAAIQADLTAERVQAAERERQAAQVERARAVRQRGHANGRRRLQTRAAQRPGPAVPRMGPARGWNRQLNVHVPVPAEPSRP